MQDLQELQIVQDQNKTAEVLEQLNNHENEDVLEAVAKNPNKKP